MVEHAAFNPIQYVPLQKKVLRYDRHPTGDGRRTIAAVCTRQGDSCVGVSSDGASISTAIKGHTPLRHWSVTVGHDEEKTWNREENRQLYKDYYRNQAGGVGTMPVFIGRRYQHGHGLAQTIGGLFKRFVMPIVALAASASVNRFWATWQRRAWKSPAT